MSSDTLAKTPAAPPAPARAGTPAIVPRRRYGPRLAAAAVLLLLGRALTSVLRDKAFQWDVVAACFTSDSVLRGLRLTLWLTAVVMRGGILCVDHGRTEAAQALGMRAGQRWRRIVLPQAMRSIVPAAGDMLIGTSVLGTGRHYVEKHYARGTGTAR